MITIRTCSDWIRIYKDDSRIFEGHSVKSSDLYGILNCFEETDYKEISDEEMENY
jgi:hypothetical protein